MKVKHGREHKRARRVAAWYEDIRLEFDRLRRLGIPFFISTLKMLAHYVLSSAENESCSRNLLDPRSNQPLQLKIDGRWVQAFMESCQIVSRARTGKHGVSPAKQMEIEIRVVAHLSSISGLLYSKSMDQNYVENAVETHFFITVENGHTLRFSEDKEVKYADVVSEGKGFIIFVRLTYGRHSHIAATFTVFKNPDCNYPIRNVPDSVPGVDYRTGK